MAHVQCTQIALSHELIAKKAMMLAASGVSSERSSAYQLDIFVEQEHTVLETVRINPFREEGKTVKM